MEGLRGRIPNPKFLENGKFHWLQGARPPDTLSTSKHSIAYYIVLALNRSTGLPVN